MGKRHLIIAALLLALFTGLASAGVNIPGLIAGDSVKTGKLKAKTGGVIPSDSLLAYLKGTADNALALGSNPWQYYMLNNEPGGITYSGNVITSGFKVDMTRNTSGMDNWYAIKGLAKNGGNGIGVYGIGTSWGGYFEHGLWADSVVAAYFRGVLHGSADLLQTLDTTAIKSRSLPLHGKADSATVADSSYGTGRLGGYAASLWAKMNSIGRELAQFDSVATATLRLSDSLLMAAGKAIYTDKLLPLSPNTGSIGSAANAWNASWQDTVNALSVIIPRKVSSGFMPFREGLAGTKNWDVTNLSGIVSGTTGNLYFWVDEVLTNIRTKGLFSTITLDSISFYGLAKSATGDSIIFSMRTHTANTFKAPSYTTKVIDTLIVPQTKGWITFTVNKNVATFIADSSSNYCITSKLPAGTPSADTLMLMGYRSYYSVAP